MTPTPYAGMIRHAPIVVLAVALLALLTAAPVHAAIEANRLGFDWVWQVEDSLVQAAVNSPKWHANREQIHRHIQDIGYFLQRAVEEAHLSDRAEAEANVRHAIDLLQRGVKKGYFRQADIEAMLTLVKQYMPDINV